MIRISTAARRLIWCSVLVSVLAPRASTAQPAPGDSGMHDPVDLYASLQEALEDGRRELDATGVSAAVILPDGRVWTGSSGEAHAGAPVTPETVFEIGSVTKTFTAALVVQLADEGILSLDDTLTAWVPGFPGADRITLRQLLRHTSGIADAMQHPGFVPTLISDPARRWGPEETFAFLAEPHAEPGAEWHYSSTGYHLLGLVVESATGRSLHELLRARFFQPLQLPRTYLGSHEDVPDPRAHAYLDFDRDGEVDDLSAVMPATSFLTAAWSAGAILSSAEDLARWMRALHTGDVLGDEAYRRMTTLVDRPDGRRYGLGLLADERNGVLLYGHEGNSAGFSAAAWHAPAAGFTVAVLANVHATKVRPVTDGLIRALEGAEPGDR